MSAGVRGDRLYTIQLEPAPCPCPTCGRCPTCGQQAPQAAPLPWSMPAWYVKPAPDASDRKPTSPLIPGVEW